MTSDLSVPAPQPNPSNDERDASLNIYLSTDHGGHPGRPHGCDWRDGRSCRNEGTVLVHLAEIDDGSSEVYCSGHAEVMVSAAVTRLWRRLRSAK